MAGRDLQGVFEERIQAIVEPMHDEAVNKVMVAFLGIAGGASRPGPGRPRKEAAGSKQACNVAACARPMRSKGYCFAHYQSARKYGWPMPAPVGFNAPVRRRGRPPKAKKETATRKAARAGKKAR